MASCSGGREVAILDGACSFGDQHELAVLDGATVHDVALATTGDGALAVWSEASGAYLARLDGTGALAGAPDRIGPPCPGGVDVTAAPVRVACGQPAHPERGDVGRVIVYAVDGATTTVRERLSPMGEGAFGVSLASSERELLVAWQHAQRGSSSVMRARLPHVHDEAAVREALGDFAPPPVDPAVRLSREGRRAGPPSALLVDGAAWVAWAETELDERGDPIGDLLVQVDDGAPRSIATVQHESAHPRLAAHEGRVLVAYRDRRDRGRPHGFAMWVPAPGRDGTLERLAPANVEGPALLVPCMGSALAIAPRTHSRHERLVSVREHRLETLEGAGPELQIYEHGEAYEHADAACVPSPSEHLLVLFAARENDDHEPGRVRTTTVSCRD